MITVREFDMDGPVSCQYGGSRYRKNVPSVGNASAARIAENTESCDAIIITSQRSIGFIHTNIRRF